MVFNRYIFYLNCMDAICVENSGKGRQTLLRKITIYAIIIKYGLQRTAKLNRYQGKLYKVP